MVFIYTFFILLVLALLIVDALFGSSLCKKCLNKKKHKEKKLTVFSYIDHLSSISTLLIVRVPFFFIFMK